MISESKKSKLLEALESVRRDFENAVLQEIHAHPDSPYWQVAERTGVSESFVLKSAQANNIRRPFGPRPKADTTGKGGL